YALVGFLKKLLINFLFIILPPVNQPNMTMKNADKRIDLKSILDFLLLSLLLITAIVYMEYSTEFQNLITAIKYNSMEGFNDGIAVLNDTSK
ncbi:MAG: hypothetical protein KJN76_00915, partial [Eudoraea sp.]|nr:hypothetical protein [Eudoraea sp.]